jgi:hypothetical protein
VLKSPTLMLSSFVVSVSTTLVYVTDPSSRPCPGGQLMSLGSRLTVSDAVSCPYLPELNVPVAITGPAMVVSFYVNAGTAARASAISARTAMMPIFLVQSAPVRQ